MLLLCLQREEGLQCQPLCEASKVVGMVAYGLGSPPVSQGAGSARPCCASAVESSAGSPCVYTVSWQV